jgi:hypothetical protein
LAQAEAKHANFDSKNTHFKSKYASLAEVIDTIKMILAKNDLAVLQEPECRDGQHVLVTLVLHKSGQFFEYEMKLNPKSDDPQGLGSAITYGKRYTLTGILCIAAEEDDDGNAASQPNPHITNTNVSSIKPSEETKKQITDHLLKLNSEEEVRKFWPAAVSRLGISKGMKEYDELTQQFNQRITQLKAVAA